MNVELIRESRVCNLLALGRSRGTIEIGSQGRTGRLSIANRRYTRFKICATRQAASTIMTHPG